MIRERLSDVLASVPFARAEGAPSALLAALRRAALEYPVFPDWPSPVDAWLDEAEALSRERGDTGALADVLIRRAIVATRRAEPASALAWLERVEETIQPLDPARRAWLWICRARALVRVARLDEARRALSEAPEGEGPSGLRLLAEGEIATEASGAEPAREALSRAWDRLTPDLLEDRITAAQLLGFAAITRADAPSALVWLDRAREMVRGAGAFREVLQMNVSTGALLTAAGDPASATALFEEALALAEEHPSPEMETLARLGLARSADATGNMKQAVSHSFQAAAAHARRGDLLGYVATIVLIASLFTRAGDFEEAYRTLTTGLVLANRRGWTPVASLMRAHIDRLRSEIVGPERFDEIVRGMIAERKRAARA